MKAKWMILIVSLVAMASICAPLVSAQGPACTNQTISGTYSFTCTGWTAAGPGGSLVPIMQVGVATGDAGGNWSGAGTINIAGQTVISNATLVGKTAVNPDCTGNIVYNKGTQTELNIDYVANPRSDQIFGLVINSGMVVSCSLQRISH